MTEERQRVPAFSGVYAIRHKASGAMYVGHSKCLDWRWQQHRQALNRGTHPEAQLQALWTSDGPSAFELVMLERLHLGPGIWRREMNALESHWIGVLAAAGVRILNRLVPTTGRIAVRQWDAEAMLPGAARNAHG